MKKTILLGSIACVLVANGLAHASEVTAQQTPAKSVVEGGLTYTDHTGQQIGTLKGEDVKGLVLMAIDNNPLYHLLTVIPKEPPEKGVAVVHASWLDVPDTNFPNRYRLADLWHVINKDTESKCDSATIISCTPDTAWLTIEPSTGLLVFEQKNAQTYQIVKATAPDSAGSQSSTTTRRDLPIFVSGSLSTHIRPNALVFQRERFPWRKFNSNLTTSVFGAYEFRNVLNFVMPNFFSADMIENNAPVGKPQPIMDLYQRSQRDFRKAQTMTFDTVGKKLLGLRRDGESWYCIESCDYQVSVSNTMTNISVDSAKLKNFSDDQPMLTISGSASFDTHQSKISFKNLNFNVMYTNVNTFVENNTAYYDFEQEHVKNDSACSSSSVQVWREEEIIKKIIVSCELPEATSGSTTESKYRIFECGLPNTPTCTGASLSADGHTFSFVKTKLSNDEELNGTLYFAGVATAESTAKNSVPN
ncbi:MAG: hypothetical protein VXW65_03310 [Pseudomonadota bacterium]|nr:hypothetical protein [Pseudomonadota bacterium]